ncbi:PDR/VanB family oxidoreductase [Pseudonocardia acaciae]|uniref:PDR/VanB family oxidoreductase n=1 Tax=Pseudonocardia acaciae TaxID=551276 RepID=UPI00068654BB|nr:PDR/VanB family oxidoreductase [Pseudonocardia acaciae]
MSGYVAYHGRLARWSAWLERRLGEHQPQRPNRVRVVDPRLVVAESVKWSPLHWLEYPSSRPRRVSLGVAVSAGLGLVAVPAVVILNDSDVMSVESRLAVWRLTERVCGIAALVLLAIAVSGGLLLSTVSAGPRGRAAFGRLHVFVAALAVVFVVLHVVSVSLLPDLGIGWLQMTVPFTREAGPFAQACGVLAAYLLLAVVVTSALRGVLPWRVWRRTHLLTVPLFGLGCAHTVLAESAESSVLAGVRAGAVMLMPYLIAWWLRVRARAAELAPPASLPPAPRELDAAARTHPLSLLISQITWEADGVMSLQLRSPDGSALPPWEPGAHVEVLLPSGRLRHYSLYGDPTERDRYRIAVLRDDTGRGGSREMHDGLRIGTRLMVAPPNNAFALEPARGYLLLAGGIGITGLLPMARVLAGGQRPWRLIYIGRSRAGMALIDQVEAVDPDKVEIVASEERGRPDLNRMIAALPSGTAVYCCGPTNMIESVTAIVAERPDLTLHVEQFAPPSGPRGAAFDVELRRTEATVRVSDDQTIVQAIAHLVPSVTGGCEQGLCGRCRATVLDGTPEHRDTFLTDADRAAGQMLLCVSRAQGERLTLDL